MSHKIYAILIFGLAIASYFYFQAFPICSNITYCGANNPLNYVFPLGLVVLGGIIYSIGGKIEGEE